MSFASVQVLRTSPPPLVPALNLDIFAFMMTFVERRGDLLSLMRTCRALYAAGIQPLIRLDTDIPASKLRSFHTFMLAHSPASFVALRRFVLEDGPAFMAEDDEYLASLMERSVRLEELRLPSHVLDTNLKIALAIASLDCLVSLRFNIGGSVFSIQNKIPSRYSLAHFSYPKLTVLELIRCSLPRLNILMSAFPNLQALTLEDRDDIPEDIFVLTPEQELVRAQNIAFQRNGRHWKSLRSLTTDTWCLFAIGLQNEIDVLEITTSLPGDRLFDLPWYLPSIGSLQAKEFRLSLNDYDVESWFDEEDFQSVFGTGMDKLVRLTVTVNFEQYYGHEEILNVLFEALEHLNLSILELNLRMSTGRSRYGELRPHPAAGFLGKLAPNMDRLRRRAVGAVNSLDVVVCTIGTTRKAWLASKEGENKLWREYQESKEGRTVITVSREDYNTRYTLGA
ncbi:hypothetical protein NM688_g4142 [Phlebia brevispora]|uniref:Uncharacterized protein n=1 Tax=Phlebia brevispora TaxID=194682 RepID=A0ACC1T3K8_9APHY|nr:hypothetical protein NM688_g4142 [Phlebia brevispora]